MRVRDTIADIEVMARRTLHSEPYAYCAHPHLAVAADGAFLLVFNRAPRRELILHPPQDPEYRNLLMRSQDEGRTWSAPAVVPDYNWSGVECAGLTTLRSGRILLNQWKFEWLPLPLAECLGQRNLTWPEQLVAGLPMSPDLDASVPKQSLVGAAQPLAQKSFLWARGGGKTVVHLSDDSGRSFFATSHIDTSPFSGGYGMRGAIELPDGDILLALSDVPNYRAVFTVRSQDGGESWSAPNLVADCLGHEFEEPAGLLLPSGRVLVMLRDNLTRIMSTVFSDDGGFTWSRPQETGIAAYPAHLLALPDGRIICIAGRRQPPFGVVMHISKDQSKTWDTCPIYLAADLPNKDLGYPTAALRSNGDLFVVYYAQDRAGVTGIHTLTAHLS